MNFKTRDLDGYRQYQHPTTGLWMYTHRRVAEKKIGRDLLPDEHVHHLNKNKYDNRPCNLVVIDERIYREVIIQSSFQEINACFRCGRTSHWAIGCRAKLDVFGRTLKR